MSRCECGDYGCEGCGELQDGDFPPFQAHSDTSFDAACAIEPSAKTERARVLRLLRALLPGGATDDEQQVTLEMNPSTQRPRRIELVRSGLVVGSELSRLTRSGRYAVVWFAVRTDPVKVEIIL